MEPEIRYSTTADGVSIAYWVMGEGPPLVYMPPMPQHPLLEWEIPSIRELYEWLISRHRVVRIDQRNSGLSDRGVEDVSLEARASDVEAVVAKLDLEPFTLFAHGLSGEAGVAFAAGRPDLVRRLILVNAAFAFPDMPAPPRMLAVFTLLQSDWGTYTEVAAGFIRGWADTEQRPRYAELLRQSQTWEDAKRMLQRPDRVVGLLPLVKAPTLVVQHRDAALTSADMGRRIAAGIPDARLVTVEGASVGSSGGDPRTRAAIAAFEELDPVRSRALAPAGTVTVLFTDIVGHTEMMQRLGDGRGREVLREHERITREGLSAHGGVEVKTDGDSFMATFASTSSAVECAIALQRAFAAWPSPERGALTPGPSPTEGRGGSAAGERIVVRMGINVWEPIEEDGDFFGSAVILGARIKDQATGGEILVPEAVRHMLSGKGFVFSDRGEVVLKGFEEGVRLFEVRWREGDV